MSNLHQSKRHDLIDMLNDTSRYLNEIFTIDNPDFEKHIPDIYPAELQLNKAKTSDKETSFLDFKAHSPVKCEIPKNTHPRHLNFSVPSIFLSPTVFDRYERVFNRAKGYKLYRLIIFEIFVSE